MFTKSLFSAVLALTLLINSGNSTFAKTDEQQNYEFYQDAMSYYGAGDYSAAIIQLKNVIQRDTRDIPARLLLAKSYLKLEQAALAERELIFARRAGAHENFILPLLGRSKLLQGQYEALLKEIPIKGNATEIEPELRVIRGIAQFARGKFKLADKEFARALRLQPDKWEAHIGMAKLHLFRGHSELAARSVDRAAEIEPEEAEIWFLKGEIHRNKRDFKTAFKHYNRAVELFPEYVTARLRRASILLDRGEAKLALADVELVQIKQPKNIQAKYFQALIQAQSNKFTEANASMLEAQQLLLGLEQRKIFDSPQLLLISGIVNYFQKNFDAAYEHLGLFVRAQPGHVGARKLLGSVLLRKKLHGRAVDMLRPAVAVLPNDIELLATFAEALMKSGKVRESTEIFARAVSISPDQKGLRTRLALTRMILGDRDHDVTDELKDIASATPNSSAANTLLIMNHMKGGNYIEAQKAAERAIQRNPRVPHLYNLLGGARAGSGDIPGAISAFDEALRVYPEFFPARLNLSKMLIKTGQTEQAKKGLLALAGAEDTKPGMEAMLLLAKIALREKDMPQTVRWIRKAMTTPIKYIEPHMMLVRIYLVDNQIKKAAEVSREVRAKFPDRLEVLEISVRAEYALYRQEFKGTERSDKAIFARRQLENTLRQMSIIASRRGLAVWMNKISRLQIQQGDIKGARKTVEILLSQNKRDIPANLSLFSLRMRVGELDAARGQAEWLVELFPDSPIGDILLGDVDMREERFAEAVTSYAHALAKKEISHIALKLYRARKKANQNALRFIEKWVADHPTDRRAIRGLAESYSSMGRHKEGIRLYESLLTQNPNDPYLLNNLALFYSHDGDLETAIARAQRALELAPDAAPIIDTLGWLWVQNGNSIRGLKLLRNAEIRAPKVAEIRYHLGVVLEKLGLGKEARSQLRKALKLSGKFKGADHARTLLDQARP